jgi:hypothetical protein
VWRFRGTPHYLGQQAARLGITQILADRARHNPEIYRVSVLMAQLCERYHKTRQEAGRPIFNYGERGQFLGTLQQCEQECDKLHALAATAAAMLDEAYAELGLPAPPRHFAVLCDYDPLPSIPLPAGDGTAANGVQLSHH